MQVLERKRSLAGCVTLIWAGLTCPGRAGAAEPAPRLFDGVYGGAGIASQNVWGGALVSGIDVLAEDRRAVLELTLGWRRHVTDRWTFGVELQYGRLDGDLQHGTPGDPLTITYRNDHQFGFGANIGRMLGASRRNLLYAYAYETTRQFEVSIADSLNGNFTQTDEQGFLRYGLALETAWSDRLRSRVAFGSYRVDFADAVTNIDVSGDIVFSVGLAYRFGGDQ